MFATNFILFFKSINFLTFSILVVNFLLFYFELFLECFTFVIFFVSHLLYSP